MTVIPWTHAGQGDDDQPVDGSSWLDKSGFVKQKTWVSWFGSKMGNQVDLQVGKYHRNVWGVSSKRGEKSPLKNMGKYGKLRVKHEKAWKTHK